MRKKGQTKVEDWTHSRSGVECAIYLEFTTFKAMLLEREFSAPDVAMLRKQLNDYAEAMVHLDWHPVIDVSTGESRASYRDEPDGESVNFGCKRFYLGESPAGELYKVDWDVDEYLRKAQMASLGGGYTRDDRLRSELKLAGLPLKAPLKQGYNRWLVPYSDELWDRCMKINESLRFVREQVTKLFKTKESVADFLAGRNPFALEDQKPAGKGKRK